MKRLAKRLAGSAAMMVAAAGLVFSGYAQGAQYTGKWDPAFGAAFPDLGWRGEATFFVPDACLASEGFVFNSGSCSGMALINAEVEFYKLSDPGNAAFQETLLFGTPSSLVIGMTITDGMLAGVLGTFGYYVDSTLPLAGAPNTEFNLSFLNDIAILDFKTWGPCEHVLSFAHSSGSCVIKRGFSDLNPPEGGTPFLTFTLVSTAVPEPAGSALIVLGLGMLAILTRRRSTSIRA